MGFTHTLPYPSIYLSSSSHFIMLSSIFISFLCLFNLFIIPLEIGFDYEFSPYLSFSINLFLFLNFTLKFFKYGGNNQNSSINFKTILFDFLASCSLVELLGDKQWGILQVFATTVPLTNILFSFEFEKPELELRWRNSLFALLFFYVSHGLGCCWMVNKKKINRIDT